MTQTPPARNSLFAELLRFGLVGVVNTLVGFSAIVFFMTIAHWSNLFANLGGYAIGLSVSYVLNRRFTFGARKQAPGAFARYIGVFLVCYALNLAVLFLLLARTEAPAIIAQGAAVLAYSLAFFALCRAFVFPARRAS